MAARLLARRAPSSASKTLTLTLARLLHPSSPLDPIPAAAGAPQCLRGLSSIASHGTIGPSDPRSRAHQSIPGPDLTIAASPAPVARNIAQAAAIPGSLSSGKIWGYDYILPCHPYKSLHAGMQTFPRGLSVKAQGGSGKHQADNGHSHLNPSTEKDNTGMMPDRSNGVEGKCSRVFAFSPLEGRISGLGSESLKIKRIELSQKITYALIPALLIISKTNLTTSLLILSVYWQIYGFFKEIFLDYVHQEATRKWVLIYFKLLLLIIAKDTFLDFDFV